MSKRPLAIDLSLYALAALAAGATALWSTLEPHRNWGAIAVGGYAPAAFALAMLLAQVGVTWFKRALVAGATGVAVAAIPLLAQAIEHADGVAGRAQEEVVVVEDAGRRLLETGSPYLHADQIAALPEPLLGYYPYQPAMALFGVPDAVFGDHWWSDARIFFMLAAAACLYGAMRLLRGAAGKGTLLRAFQASVLLPVCALTFATGGDDMPVVCLAVLALALCSRERWFGAGLAVGAAASLKLFAWPVAVVLALLVRRRGPECLRRHLGGFAVPVAVSLLPVLLVDFRGFADNSVAFGLGHGVVESPARSPLPGFLIAEYVPFGDLIAPALLGAAAVLIAALLWQRPPETAAGAALWCAAGLSAAFLLMPATRFGYLLYPAILLGWWLALRDAAAAAPERAAAPSGRRSAGPSLLVEWWR
ncbi:glycosyltransferase 87 family protein [Glycomyces xiaoerkulensis]|uniref:glycosyltransferase 87 family protein n=1 Tax=Glycomyces xiaoerkulensis TaxID=2038139 RepID=UPI000C2634F9|nr:glycosyltransferase 87 family protein [Glycomyces xiaoerkulensis]